MRVYDWDPNFIGFMALQKQKNPPNLCLFPPVLLPPSAPGAHQGRPTVRRQPSSILIQEEGQHEKSN